MNEMAISTKNRVQIPAKELSKILKAYNTIGEFLETFLDRRVLYREEFFQGLDQAVKEVSERKTKKVKNFADFVS